MVAIHQTARTGLSDDGLWPAGVQMAGIGRCAGVGDPDRRFARRRVDARTLAGRTGAAPAPRAASPAEGTAGAYGAPGATCMRQRGRLVRRSPGRATRGRGPSGRQGLYRAPGHIRSVDFTMLGVSSYFIKISKGIAWDLSMSLFAHPPELIAHLPGGGSDRNACLHQKVWHVPGQHAPL